MTRFALGALVKCIQDHSYYLRERSLGSIVPLDGKYFVDELFKCGMVIGYDRFDNTEDVLVLSITGRKGWIYSDRLMTWSPGEIDA